MWTFILSILASLIATGIGITKLWTISKIFVSFFTDRKQKHIETISGSGYSKQPL